MPLSHATWAQMTMTIEIASRRASREHMPISFTRRPDAALLRIAVGASCSEHRWRPPEDLHAHRRASVLRAAESYPRETQFRRVRRRTVRAVLRRGWRPGLPPGALLPTATDRLFRRAGRGTRNGVAGGRFVCPARMSRTGIARGAAGPFDHFPHASLDRSRDARSGLHLDVSATR